MRANAHPPHLFIRAAAALAPLFVASAAPASPAATRVVASPARASVEAWPASSDELLSEIQTHFRSTRKWFGMVSDLRLDRAADGTVSPRFETLQSKFVLRNDAAGQTLHARLPPQ